MNPTVADSAFKLARPPRNTTIHQKGKDQVLNFLKTGSFFFTFKIMIFLSHQLKPFSYNPFLLTPYCFNPQPPLITRTLFLALHKSCCEESYNIEPRKVVCFYLLKLAALIWRGSFQGKLCRQEECPL